MRGHKERWHERGRVVIQTTGDPGRQKEVCTCRCKTSKTGRGRGRTRATKGLKDVRAHFQTQKINFNTIFNDTCEELKGILFHCGSLNQ